MQTFIPIVVGMLMVSIGMSLSIAEMSSTVRRLTWLAWARLLLATFILPAFLSLGLSRLFRLSPGEVAGLFLIGVAPGAPLLTQNLARRGFNMHMAATYQLWAALMIPIMIPLTVFAAGKLYSRNIWIPPRLLLWQIIEKQLIPLAIGMGIARLAPAVAKRLQPGLNLLGNLMLTVFLVLLLWKLSPEVKQLSPLLPPACLLLALGCVLAVWMMRLQDRIVKETFAISNANRHVGLAVLLSGEYVHAQHVLPAIACYALVAALLLFVYARLTRMKKPAVKKAGFESGNELVSS
jgi:BASS family bile acid:Na+ symporter